MTDKPAPADVLAERSHVGDYASDRVVDGVRPVSPSRLAKLRASYARSTRHEYPSTPGHRGVFTQVAAAESIKPCTSRLHKMIVGYLTHSGEATRQELADDLGLKLQTVCGRVRELVLAGQVKDTDIVRNGGRVVRVA